MYIATRDELVSFCERAKQHAVLAVDTEFLRERTYRPKLCLVQVATEEEAVAIDPLAVDDLAPLRELFEDDTKTKVFHACGQDLETIYDSMGCIPAPMFDTQIAAAFLGHRMQMGYGALVQAYAGVHLDKADGLTDWSKRPLDEEQLRYAEDDVRYLPGIYRSMMDELVARDRLSWVEPEFEALCDESRLNHDPSQAYLHLKRSSSLSRRQLAIAREVCSWRECVADKRNLPKRWVVSDEVIVEICRQAPTKPERLRRIRGTDNLSDRDVAQLLRAVGRGKSCDVKDLPRIRHRPRARADTDGVIDLMYAMLRLCAEQADVAIPLVATRDDLQALASGDPDASLRHGWRHEIAGGRLEGLLRGEVGLTVKDGRIETL